MGQKCGGRNLVPGLARHYLNAIFTDEGSKVDLGSTERLQP